MHALATLTNLPFIDLTEATFKVTLRGADKSLARPGRKKATATEHFDFHISYL